MTDKPAQTTVRAAPFLGEADQPQVVTRRAVGIVSLRSAVGRPSFTSRTCVALAEAYQAFARDPIIYAATLRSEAADVFCAGLDYGQLASIQDRDACEAQRFIADSLRLCWAHECFSKPTVSLINGSVLGCGLGIVLYGTHRVGGTRFNFRCPETGFGLVPGHGICWAMARLPDAIGVYLALTGRTIGTADAFRLGLLTHLVAADDFDAIEAHLADADPVDAMLDTMHAEPGPAELMTKAPLIARCFAATSIEEIIGRLEMISGPDENWAKCLVADLRQKSPLALKVTHALLQSVRTLDLRAALALEYRLTCRLIASRDFHEAMAQAAGTRVRPSWTPVRLEEVTADMVSQCFAADPRLDLTLPPRTQMQTAR